MAAYRRVYDSHHLQADCQEPGSAPERYAWQSSVGYIYVFAVEQRAGPTFRAAVAAEWRRDSDWTTRRQLLLLLLCTPADNATTQRQFQQTARPRDVARW